MIDQLRLMRSELYFTCAVTSATLYVWLSTIGLSFAVAAWLAFAAGFSLRGVAIVFGVTFPRFRS